MPRGRSRLRAVAADRRLRIAPDHIYLVPWRSSISIRDGAIVFSRRTAAGRQRNTVDVLFRALARDAGPLAIASSHSSTHDAAAR
ncbi:MAG TPA: chemotaxis protein CheB [Bryobacteraceae bacterium]|nr:chemotaxis protein CheB [Bryobacteraceae bacterium]